MYRNRTTAEVRDISVTRYVDGAWQPGRTIAADGPVVRVSISTDNGETFSAPTNVIDGNTLGRVGLALLDDGDLGGLLAQDSR